MLNVFINHIESAMDRFLGFLSYILLLFIFCRIYKYIKGNSFHMMEDDDALKEEEKCQPTILESE